MRFPPLEVDESASQIVEAILREDTIITIPTYMKPLCKFMAILPNNMQAAARDLLMREHENAEKKSR